MVLAVTVVVTAAVVVAVVMVVAAEVVAVTGSVVVIVAVAMEWQWWSLRLINDKKAGEKRLRDNQKECFVEGYNYDYG